jgi:hypothetical protein
MEKVTVRKEALVEKLRENRELHLAQFKEAAQGYQQAMVKELRQEIDAVESYPTHRVRITHFPPEDHTSDYDRALRMLDMAIDETFIVTLAEFARYIDDDWEWKQIWNASTMKYLNK